jgi:CDP-diacylglycerol--serine O-phosphatidyltransferase
LQQKLTHLKKHIPNAFTSFNLVFGCLSIIAALDGRLTDASIFIGAAAILDFFDGFVARALKVHSELGKQLDSLADVVSFGVAPGMIFYMLSAQCYSPSGFCINMYIPFLIPVFSAIRLANFNIDTRQSDSFIGLPVPANAIFIASIPFIMEYNSVEITSFFQHPWFLTLFPFASAYILVAELPLIALKFKNFSWADNKVRYIFLGLSLVSIIALQFLGIALAILLYILVSIIHNIQNKQS